ncbi:UNVERIFIED_CONTAM: hypothetical protein PYX00_009322 [Menopon gallinae]|uniref:Transmembrane protein 50A n=1 Tax=Menopon gallinae TaxID=328185 RepID=A0AAW2HAZ1_9NEOP
MSLSSCLERLNLQSCIWFQNGEYRNAVASIVSGILFFMGWWFIIDVQVTCSDDFKGSFHLCGIFGTISLLMVNSVSNAVIRGNDFGGGSCGAKLWLFLGFVMGFASVIAACWILFANFLLHEPDSKPLAVWVGAGLFLQNCFIFIASLVYKFGRVDDQW